MKKLTMGSFELYTAHIEHLLAFYKDLVGLQILAENGEYTELGFGDTPIIRLIEDLTLPSPSRRGAGLYHSAILFRSRGALVQAILRVLHKHPELYVGSGDHLVSEAFYFNDPEGNGVELYFDRDPSTWVWENGQIKMASEFIDVEEYILQNQVEAPSQEKKLGHMHLQVGDIQIARTFYVDIIGLAVTAQMETALFLSDGKYHHHIGLNTWRSFGAGKRTKTLGLKNFTLLLEDQNELSEIENSLKSNDLPYAKTEKSFTTWDPWGNELVLGLS